ncbi:membrane protein insertion efficiency factor YidD [Glaciimonas sp. CA11.2]|uniref:membrane protein insertion efficiency factor YidD n=1 Tax=Glaciimonas sp. CA11.2 TaxID=3048601 RepID=UPI002AB542B0|nr:membrane protein insertion efficiency factor YidD [Glaciimonas sp. CA11.2]MDY7546097.1 membrane protein insertion efficiency factor YidD [Glaciimonas sp. CA11.2]MEB0161676.1 membrane protein insertion efficiency factor YidD [Glaciimonas sp. CA11.2]
MKATLLFLLRCYKLGISPFLGQNCRFYPSCSDYAAEAIRTHGALKGSILAACRLGKCHPWHAGGIDPVPSSPSASAASCASSAKPSATSAERPCGCSHS